MARGRGVAEGIAGTYTNYCSNTIQRFPGAILRGENQ